MTHTACSLIVAVGQTVQVRVEKWVVPMMVRDAKSAYGVPRVQVEPLYGEGLAWIDLCRIVVPAGTSVVLR